MTTCAVRWLGTGSRTARRSRCSRPCSTNGVEDHLLLLEHPHVFTHGPRADLAVNVLVDPAAVGADLVSVKRGGDVTYHGPGQLVGYPIVNVPNAVGAADHVCAIQRVIVASLTELGVADVGCLDEYPGVWVGVSGPNPRKICAIGVRLAHGRTMHGFALNVAPDMRYMREYIVPCGISDKPVTSLAEEGIDASMEAVADVVARHAASMWGGRRNRAAGRRMEASSRRPLGVLRVARVLVRVVRRFGPASGVADGLSISTRKPEWLRPKVVHGPEVISLKQTVRDLGLVTVCEEAGCPNLSDCWADGTATFMVLGERCTRACGFCLVDTRKPLAPADDEPGRVAEAVARMGLGSRGADDGGPRRSPRRRDGTRRPLRRGNSRTLSHARGSRPSSPTPRETRIRWHCCSKSGPTC